MERDIEHGTRSVDTENTTTNHIRAAVCRFMLKRHLSVSPPADAWGRPLFPPRFFFQNHAVLSKCNTYIQRNHRAKGVALSIVR